jgi:hypothetical protein
LREGRKKPEKTQYSSRNASRFLSLAKHEKVIKSLKKRNGALRILLLIIRALIE